MKQLAIILMSALTIGCNNNTPPPTESTENKSTPKKSTKETLTEGYDNTKVNFDSLNTALAKFKEVTFKKTPTKYLKLKFSVYRELDDMWSCKLIATNTTAEYIDNIFVDAWPVDAIGNKIQGADVKQIIMPGITKGKTITSQPISWWNKKGIASIAYNLTYCTVYLKK